MVDASDLDHAGAGLGVACWDHSMLAPLIEIVTATLAGGSGVVVP